MNTIHWLRHTVATLAFLCSICMLHSCSDSVGEKVVERKSRVRVEVRPFHFDIENESMRVARSISDAATRLSFAVFDAKGALVGSAIYQNSSDDVFGTVELELIPGAYQLVAVAHNGDADATITSTTSVTLPGTTFTDTFTKVQELTVEADKDTNFEMQLPRATSAFILRVTDTLPANLKEIKVVVNTTGFEPTSLTINPTDGLASGHWRQTRTIAAADISKDKPIYFIKQYTATAVNVKATAYDVEGTVIISHEIKNVPLNPNQKTIATGRFFTPHASGSFALETTWAEDLEIDY